MNVQHIARLALFAAFAATLGCSGKTTVATGDAGSCVPTSCEALGATCGFAGDGCGGVVECGLCPSGETCGATAPNQCAVGECAPSSCANLGVMCGLVGDGCAGMLDCGPCDDGGVVDAGGLVDGGPLDTGSVDGGTDTCEPKPELCATGVDEDCDGATDEGECGECELPTGPVRPTSTFIPPADGWRAIQDGDRILWTGERAADDVPIASETDTAGVLRWGPVELPSPGNSAIRDGDAWLVTAGDQLVRLGPAGEEARTDIDAAATLRGARLARSRDGVVIVYTTITSIYVRWFALDATPTGPAREIWSSEEMLPRVIGVADRSGDAVVAYVRAATLDGRPGTGAQLLHVARIATDGSVAYDVLAGTSLGLHLMEAAFSGARGVLCDHDPGLSGTGVTRCRGWDVDLGSAVGEWRRVPPETASTVRGVGLHAAGCSFGMFMRHPDVPEHRVAYFDPLATAPYEWIEIDAPGCETSAVSTIWPTGPTGASGVFSASPLGNPARCLIEIPPAM